jgi:hypothetical protein
MSPYLPYLSKNTTLNLKSILEIMPINIQNLTPVILLKNSAFTLKLLLKVKAILRAQRYTQRRGVRKHESICNR